MSKVNSLYYEHALLIFSSLIFDSRLLYFVLFLTITGNLSLKSIFNLKAPIFRLQLYTFSGNEADPCCFQSNWWEWTRLRHLFLIISDIVASWENWPGRHNPQLKHLWTWIHSYFGETQMYSLLVFLYFSPKS